MAELPAVLFFQGGRDYRIGSLSFDLVLEEQHTFANRVTSHPVEDGSPIADHIENELLNGSLSALITNFSLKTEEPASNRAQDAFNEIERLWRMRELVTIVTVMRVYEDVAIRSVSVARSSDTGEAIALNVEFQAVRRVSLKRANLDVTIDAAEMDDDINRQAAPPADVGQTTAEPISPVQQERIDRNLAGVR